VSLERALELRARCDYRGALAALAGADDAGSLIERSRLQEDLGEYEAARADAERAAELAEDTTLAASAQTRIAAVARAQRHPAEALAILDGVGGAEADVERAAALADLARLDEAEPLLRSLRSGDARLQLQIQLGLGGIACGRGHYDQAARELRTALADAEATFGREAVETATALNALGVVCKYSGRFEEGIWLYQRARVILEGVGGQRHPDLATIDHNVGGLEPPRRNFEQAEPYARRSVELRRRSAGVDAPAVAEDEAAWASILHALGRDAEAERLLQHALPLLEQALGSDHPEVAGAWNNLAAIRTRQGDYDGADEAYTKALQAKQQTMGPDHPSIAITLNNLAVNARKRGDTTQAEALYRRALAILEGRVEPDHPNLLLTRRNYAKLLHATGREQSGPPTRPGASDHQPQTGGDDDH
jgi:tetratricopeptide (TPR) repeat protein